MIDLSKPDLIVDCEVVVTERTVLPDFTEKLTLPDLFKLLRYCSADVRD